MNRRIISNADPAKQRREENKKRGILMSVYWLLGKVLIFSPLCFLFSYLAISNMMARQPHVGYKLAYGTWAREGNDHIAIGPLKMDRPRVRIQIDGTREVTRPVLYYSEPDDLPAKVSFYYSGDPDIDVTIIEENSPIWLAIGSFLLPFALASIVYYARKKADA